MIFTTQRTEADVVGYAETAERPLQLATSQLSSLDIADARDSSGIGITVSY
jgi:hypothetical protein